MSVKTVYQQKFLRGALASYCGSYDLNLGQTLGRAAWEILTACRGERHHAWPS